MGCYENLTTVFDVVEFESSNKLWGRIKTNLRYTINIL